MTKPNKELSAILSLQNSEHKFEELISWLMDSIRCPFEIQKDFSERRRKKNYSQHRLLAEGSTYQPDNFTEHFGPRIIFKLFLDLRYNEWFFEVIFQFDEQCPLDFSKPHKVALPYLDINKELFKEFMKNGSKRSYKQCVKNV